MKNLLLSLGLLASISILNGCGGDNQNPPNPEPMVINIGDIVSGYQFNGTIENGQKAGEKTILIFCPDKAYTYYRGNNESFHGTYSINDSGTEVLLKDDTDGGSYALQTNNHLFEEGKFYSCRGLESLTTGMRLNKITEHPCLNNQ